MQVIYRGNRRGTSLRSFTRQMRAEPTDSEHLLWTRLRNLQLEGAKFRRQHELGPYILDFFCAEHRLVIEVDGGQHFSEEGEDRDRERTAYLEARGLHVLRFSNVEVLQETDGVLEEIRRAIFGVASRTES